MIAQTDKEVIEELARRELCQPSRLTVNEQHCFRLEKAALLRTVYESGSRFGVFRPTAAGLAMIAKAAVP